MKKPNILKLPKKIDIIGVPISTVNMEEALNFTYDNFKLIRGRYVCASNVHTTVMASGDKEYLKIQSESVMSLPDGKPLSVIGKKRGYVYMEKVTGTHYMLNIFNDVRFNGYKHYFYGTTQENINDLVFQAKKKYPKLSICGSEASIFRELTEEEVDELARRVNDSGADFLWVGIGAPRQEKLMNRLQNKVNCLMIGVGGAFNILSGKVNDAPIWMQNIGLEWLYRFIKEPRRLFKRYAITNTKFIWLYLKNK